MRGVGEHHDRRLVPRRDLDARLHPRRQCVGVQISDGADLGERDLGARHALDRHDTADQLEVFRRRLEQVCGDLQHFRARLVRGLHRRSAGDGRGAAAAGPRAVRRRGRVALVEPDVVDIHAELVGDHLDDGRLQALPMAARAHQHVDLAARLDAQGGGLGGKDSEAELRFDVDRQADPEVTAFGTGVGLLPAETGVVDQLRGLLEGLGRADRLVDQAGGGRERQLGALDDVAPPDLERVDTQPFGRDVHHLFAGDRLHHPRAAVGTVSAGVRVQTLGLEGEPLHAVRPGEHHGRGAGRPCRRPGWGRRRRSRGAEPWRRARRRPRRARS